MLSKSVSRAGENSVIWKFEHFGRRGYTIFFSSFFGHFRLFPTFNCGIDHSGSQPFILYHCKNLVDIVWSGVQVLTRLCQAKCDGKCPTVTSVFFLPFIVVP